VSGRGHQASLPPGGFTAKPPLAASGLVVTVVNKAGHEKAFDFVGLPVPGPMQRSLAAAFAAQSRRWSGHASADGYWRRLRLFARFLSGQADPPDDLDGLTVALLKRWRAAHVGTNDGRHAMAVIRALLRQDPRLRSGPVADELARRIPNPRPSGKSYDEAERERVMLAARRQFRAALQRIGKNASLLQRWQAGELPEGSREWRLGQVLSHLAQAGDVPRVTGPSGRTNMAGKGLLGGQRPEQTWARLFLTRMELTALAVLLTDRFGWNLAVLDRMPAPVRTPSAGETATITHQVQVEKRRRGGGHWFSTENITDSGAGSPGRLITQALEATFHGRTLAARLAPGTDLLMTARTSMPRRRQHQDLDRPRAVGPLIFGISSYDAYDWPRRHNLGGSPFLRTRRTTVTREGRPLQHARGTHESIYVLPNSHVQSASRQVFEDGAYEALEQARAAVFGGHLGAEPDPAHQETATADCADEAASPWSAPDGGCGADFLLCLGCPNAHVHPGHYPRLAHLHQQVRSLRTALPDQAWTVRWHDHLQRLEDLRDKTGASAWNSALARVTSADRALVSLLLKGNLSP
jgi:hypothetical protein